MHGRVVYRLMCATTVPLGNGESAAALFAPRNSKIAVYETVQVMSRGSVRGSGSGTICTHDTLGKGMIP